MGHSHAFILGESNPASGRRMNGEITHLTVYARAGFGSRERSALENLWEIRGSGLQVGLALQGLGWPEDFGGLDVGQGKSPLLAESRIWVSRTPFVPTRHPKVTRAGAAKRDETGLQIGSPEHELLRLLRLEGFPEPLAVEPASYTELAGQRIGWSRFHKTRSFGDGRKAGSVGYGFQIEFAEAVRGPVAVGYASHFGMGEFVPEQNRNQMEINETEMHVRDERSG